MLIMQYRIAGFFEDNKFCEFFRISKIKFLENQFSTVKDGTKAKVHKIYFREPPDTGNL